MLVASAERDHAQTIICLNVGIQPCFRVWGNPLLLLCTNKVRGECRQHHVLALHMGVEE